MTAVYHHRYTPGSPAGITNRRHACVMEQPPGWRRPTPTPWPASVSRPPPHICTATWSRA
ncbi:hypothetical protein BDI4_170027 [Burkholderia diffusa]|nr:hypothetical protein BDI4_170027 [Burkholderia diffusa]